MRNTRRIGKRTPPAGRQQAGYMLLILMLAVAMISIALLSVAQNYRRSIVRDREVEMVHRGLQYERAIRVYYRKNHNQYPTTLEQLEGVNKMRYLRKRYKDPMTKDGVWGMARLNDVTAVFKNAGLGASINMNAVVSSSGRGISGDLSTVGTAAANAADNNGSAFGSGPAVGGSGNAQSTVTQNQGAAGSSPDPNNPSLGAGNAPDSSGSSSSSSTFGSPGNNPTAAGNVLGGGPILGVVSKSKLEGIHSFAQKTHYNEWLFVYDPGQDRGLPTAPYDPNAFLPGGPAVNYNAVAGANQPGVPLQSQPPAQPSPAAPQQ